MDKRVWIYALSCPLTSQVKYVGRSKDPAKRFQRHIENNGGEANSTWLAELKQVGVVPTLEYLERVPETQGYEAEAKWIHLLRAHGHDLANKVYKGAKRPDVSARFAEQRRRIAY